MGLIVWLPLNGDMRNNGLGNATLASTSATFTDGPWGKALSCNGSTYWTVNGITLGNDATIACWGKTSVSGKMKWVLQANVYAHLNLFESSFYTLNTGDSNNNPFKDGSNNVPVLTDNKWHHFVVTFGNNQAKLYIDGQYRGTATTFKSPACSIKNIRIAGGFSNSHSYDYNGAIDDFRVYDNCLTEDDIKNLYNRKTFDLVNQCNVAFNRAGQIASGVVPYNVTTSGSAFYLNGSNAAIQIPFTDMQSGEFTMNTWFYKDSFGSKSWDTILGGPSGFELQTKRSSTNSPVIAMYSWNNQAAADIPYSLNQWNMLTMARTSGGTKFYLNGEYKQSGTAGSIPATSSTAGQYFIGAWKTSSSQNFKGYIKDFQIYAKELQASEISKLYAIGPQTDTDFNQNYTRLEYIQSTGTQWINTGINPKVNPRVVAKFKFINNTDCDYWGNNAIAGSAYYADFYNRNLQYYRYGSTTSQNVNYAVPMNELHEWDVSKNVYVDGNLKFTSQNTYTYSSAQTSIYIFKAARANYYSSYQLYDFKLYDGNDLVRHFIPSKRKSDNVIGLYDLVSNTFFTNAGTGTFTAGPAL